jgi:hypothetical protein
MLLGVLSVAAVLAAKKLLVVLHWGTPVREVQTKAFGECLVAVPAEV